MVGKGAGEGGELLSWRNRRPALPFRCPALGSPRMNLRISPNTQGHCPRMQVVTEGRSRDVPLVPPPCSVGEALEAERGARTSPGRWAPAWQAKVGSGSQATEWSALLSCESSCRSHGGGAGGHRSGRCFW